jgi:hypothetical protein
MYKPFHTAQMPKWNENWYFVEREALASIFTARCVFVPTKTFLPILAKAQDRERKFRNSIFIKSKNSDTYLWQKRQIQKRKA